MVLCKIYMYPKMDPTWPHMHNNLIWETLDLSIEGDLIPLQDAHEISCYMKYSEQSILR